jgi:hypothetical protein
VQMGLLPDSIRHFRNILIDFYSGFPAAFYVTGTDSLYIINSLEYDDTLLHMIIAHELTHALQDQNFNLNLAPFPGYSQYNSDAQAAVRALLEGDATLAEYRYYLTTYIPWQGDRDLTIETYANEARDYFLSPATSWSFPQYLDIDGMSPYTIGFYNVTRAYQRAGGWSGVDALYSVGTVARSSAQVMTDSVFSPTYFEFRDILDLMRSKLPGTAFVDDDNGGFLRLYGLFRHTTTAEAAGRAFGWRGDRYAFAMNADAVAGTLVWAIDFATTQSSADMFQQFSDLLRTRTIHGIRAAAIDSLIDTAAGMTTYTFSSTGFNDRLMRSGTQVWWIENGGELEAQIVAILKRQQTAALVKSAAVSRAVATAGTLALTRKRASVDALNWYLFRQ